MAFLVFDYTCTPCGRVCKDEFVKAGEEDKQACPECGDNMSIVPFSPKLDWDSLAMGDSASPEAIRHWEKKRKQQQTFEEKSKAEHGDRGPAPGA